MSDVEAVAADWVDVDSAERGGFSRSALLRRGWTRRMIEQLLPGGPDATASNPHYSSSTPMQLYDIDRVRSVEQTEAFRALQSVLRRKPRQPTDAPAGTL